MVKIADYPHQVRKIGAETQPPHLMRSRDLLKVEEDLLLDGRLEYYERDIEKLHGDSIKINIDREKSILSESDRIKQLCDLYPGLSVSDAQKVDRDCRTLAEAFNGPALWKNRSPDDDTNVAQWVLDHYGNRSGDRSTWNPQGLTRKILRSRDFLLSQALDTWVSRHKEDRELFAMGENPKDGPALSGAERQARYRKRLCK